jgi:hypothetical protein
LVWGALALGVAPLWLFLPLIRANLTLRQGYFAPATWANFARGTIETFLPMKGALGALFVLSVTLSLVAPERGSVPRRASGAQPCDYEVAACIALLLAPLVAFVAGRLVTGVYVARYAIVTVIGFSILLPLILRHVLSGRAGALPMTLVGLCACFAAWYGIGPRTTDPAPALTQWLRRANPTHVPIVVADPLTYLPLAHDAPPDIARDLIYVPDEREALAYRGVNTSEHNLAALKGAAPLHLWTVGEATSRTTPYFVLWGPSRFSWIVAKLRDAGRDVEFVEERNTQILFAVRPPQTSPFAKTYDGKQPR